MENDRLLRGALSANALFSTGSGALLLLEPDRIASCLRMPEWMAQVTGAALVGYGVALGLLARVRRAPTAWAVVVTALDVAWVAGSAALVTLREVHSAALVAIPAALVATFAAAQIEGLRRATFDTDGTGRLVAERRVNAPSERAWAVVSDVDGYAEFAGTLNRSVVVSGRGVGMVRRCEDKAGICWLETCSRWEPGRAYAFDVDTSGPKYPLPLRTMRGDFEVDPEGPSSSTIRILFTFTARGGWLTETLLALTFAARGNAIVGAILFRWAERIEQEPRLA